MKLALLHREAEPQSVAQVHRAHREAEVILHGEVGAGLAFRAVSGLGKTLGGECKERKTWGIRFSE